ncbi:MAG: type IV secretion protein Rhs [Candidatus Viridilinea halotolerans]|uniref:Type IV secretion protein Rhs n=1 Tax=Candidatus Viridilinea halotolerans TaxID=2491704 RepID=A0A426U9D0_9CHLR|nr:MAG: type IV secretion protein Rhs [Candidatus Viridilinea halotolerans]
MTSDTLLSHLALSLGGSTPPDGLLAAIDQLSVEMSLHLPSVATLVIHDPALAWVDHSLLLPGTTLVVNSGKGEKLFDGEIVELEADFGIQGQRVIVRAFDRLHRLARVRYQRAFKQKSDDEIVSACAGDVGLSAQATATSGQHEHYLQLGISNLALAQELAAAHGFLLFVDGQKLHFEPPTSSSTVTLEWGANLSNFRPRLSATGYVQEVTVRGWDAAAKKAVVGVASSSKVPPGVGVAPKNFISAVTPKDGRGDPAIITQDQAKAVAQNMLDGHLSRFVEADGVALGNAGIKAGASVEISGVGTRFSGTYFVTGATHQIVPGESYTTEFSVSGLHPSSILAMLGNQHPSTMPHGAGLTLGLVVDNKDPDSLGRVKVKFPLFYDADAGAEVMTDWLPMMASGAGKERGLYFLPEIDDEVIVAFGHGRSNAPLVLGALWNGKDAPPGAQNDLVDGSGLVKRRSIYSRTGNYIVLDDSDDNGGISIIDSKGNKFVFKVQDDSLTIEAAGPITVTTKADLSFDVTGNATLKAKGNLNLEATGNIGIKATGNLKAEATGQAEVSGTTGAKLSSAAMVDVKGAMINLN